MNSLQKISTIVVFVFVLSAVGPIQHQEVQGNKRAATYALEHDVRAYGAKGDGRTLDTEAINKAVEAAAMAVACALRPVLQLASCAASTLTTLWPIMSSLALRRSSVAYPVIVLKV